MKGGRCPRRRGWAGWVVVKRGSECVECSMKTGELLCPYGAKERRQKINCCLGRSPDGPCARTVQTQASTVKSDEQSENVTSPGCRCKV